MASTPYWTITFEGHDYQWNGISSLTSARLRAYKNTYGEEYGKANAFNQKFLQGDCDAVCCVVWSLLKDRAKEEPGFKAYNSPNELPDFSVGDLVNDMYTELLTRTADDEDPTEPEAVPSENDQSPILDSTEILTIGEESSSPPSPKSSGTRSRR